MDQANCGESGLKDDEQLEASGEAKGKRRIRDSRVLSSDVCFNLVMPELTTLRKELNSRDNSIDTLKRSVSNLEGKNQDLSQTLCRKIAEIKFLGEKLHVAEAAAMDAVRDVCKEREQAEKVASDYRQQYQVCQTKLKREIDKYHKLHKNWETGKRAWTEERKIMQENQRNAGIKLLAVLEEFLDAQGSVQRYKQPGDEDDSAAPLIVGNLRPSDLSKGDESGIQKAPEDPEHFVDPAEPQPCEIKGRKNSGKSNAANTSIKRLSMNGCADNTQSLSGTNQDDETSKEQQHASASGIERAEDDRGRKRKSKSQSRRTTSSRTASRNLSQSRNKREPFSHSVSEYMDNTSINIPSLRSRSQKSSVRKRAITKSKKKKSTSMRPTSQVSLDRAYIDTCMGFYAAGMVNASLHSRHSRPRTPKSARTPRTPNTPNSERLSTAPSKAASTPRGLYIPPRLSSVNFHQQNHSRSRGNIHSVHDFYSTQRSYVYAAQRALWSEDIPPVPDLSNWKYNSKNSPYSRAAEPFPEAQPVHARKFNRLRKIFDIFSQKRVVA